MAARSPVISTGSAIYEIANPWAEARRLGLRRSEYGLTWSVYASMAEYEEGRD